MLKQYPANAVLIFFLWKARAESKQQAPVTVQMVPMTIGPVAVKEAEWVEAVIKVISGPFALYPALGRWRVPQGVNPARTASKQIGAFE